MRLLIACLMLISCGKVETANPSVDSPALKEQVERVEPLLAWTCDGRVPARRHDFPCVKEGDAISMTGSVLMLGGIGDFSVILDSIDQDGKLWRNPERINNDTEPTCSRDQVLGLLEGSVATGNRSGLQSFMHYLSKNGRACDHDACRITPSIRTLFADVLGEKVSEAERAFDAETLMVEAEAVPPNYQAYLVARKIMLHIQTKTLTTGYAKAAKRLSQRFPESLYIETVNNVASGENHKHLIKALTACLRDWKQPGPDWFGSATESHCTDRMQGNDLVALAKYLLR